LNTLDVLVHLGSESLGLTDEGRDVEPGRLGDTSGRPRRLERVNLPGVTMGIPDEEGQHWDGAVASNLAVDTFEHLPPAFGILERLASPPHQRGDSLARLPA
jgi:hypothetical protein